MAAFALAAALFCARLPAQQAGEGLLRVRVGTPTVVRGPANNIADSQFTGVRLPNGIFRGFTALGSTLAIDGKEPWMMGGPAVTVLKVGPPHSASSCGQWLQHVELMEDQTLLGWVHQETACNYAKDQSHFSTVMATSKDYGLTWKMKGTFMASTEGPIPNQESGDDCSEVVRGQDGYFYASCTHNGAHNWYGGYRFLARAPIANPMPGQWKRYYNGAWTEPGIGGKATPVETGPMAFWLPENKSVALTRVKGGFGLQLSSDYIHFTPLFAEPLVLQEGMDWSRKDGRDLWSYQVLIDAMTGSNQLSDHWLLVYMYLRPQDKFDKRSLVFQRVDMARNRKPDEPEVGVMLTDWIQLDKPYHVSTLAPVPGHFKVNTQLGYTMTAADSKRKSVELEECVNQLPGHPDEIVMAKGACVKQKYQPLRSAGWVFAEQQPDTKALYQCYDAAEKSHFVSNHADCDHTSRAGYLLGYALSR
jgi:hypothetical protein